MAEAFKATLVTPIHIRIVSAVGGERGGKDRVGGEDTRRLVLIPCGRLAAVRHLVANGYTVLVSVDTILPGVLIVSECKSVLHSSIFTAVLIIIVVLIEGASIG
jgi:hypothetical protein